MTSEVTQADRKAIDRAEAFAKSKHTTPDEHDDIMVAVRLARLTAQSGEGERLREALFFLASAEAEYRRLHDLHGDGDIRTGRAWDRMRRRGDEARAALRATDEGRDDV